MNKRPFAVTALLAAMSILAGAQTGTPPNPPAQARFVNNRVARLAKFLDLTSSQQQQATAIFATEESSMAPIQTSMRTARLALRAAVKANDASGINTQAATIGTLTTQQVQARATADAAFYAILSPDQQGKYESLGPGIGGFGAPGRPRGGGTH